MSETEIIVPDIDVVEIDPVELTVQDMANTLSMLCKTDDGLNHAYVKISASQMKLTDISLLDKYHNLRYVDLANNNISNFKPLAALNSLLWLNIQNNLADSADLGEFHYLQVLDFSSNKLTSAEGINLPSLEQLDLTSNDIPSCSPLDPEKLQFLSILQMANNKLTTTSGLSNFVVLKELYLGHNEIADLEGICTLDSLEILHLRGNRITTFGDNIQDNKLSKLRYINLRANSISSLDEVKKLAILPSLSALVLLENPIVEEEEYRIDVLIHVRRLVRLDKDPFDEDERELASERQEMLAQQAKEAAAEAEAAEATVDNE